MIYHMHVGFWFEEVCLLNFKERKLNKKPNNSMFHNLAQHNSIQFVLYNLYNIVR